MKNLLKSLLITIFFSFSAIGGDNASLLKTPPSQTPSYTLDEKSMTVLIGNLVSGSFLFEDVSGKFETVLSSMQYGRTVAYSTID